MPELLTPSEVAKLLKINEITLFRWRKQSKGPPWIQIGRQIRYDKNEIIKFLNTNTQNEN